ncbi:L-seryl-tRNA(Sec) selenium transferase [Actinophytocola oryzae]|uniref:L-seryl-tRNA(Sec) selenium transferase n=1 Tax=Actinophytocola oryzae TaxID=502181 RepID=A0A4R7W1E7_9PSEU|nr:L-seryl-tRNA(Sec) selenium transferase [Actinophytocola oryzae]
MPRTDEVLADPRLVEAVTRVGRPAVKAAVAAAQQRARAGEIAPEAVADTAVAALPARGSSLNPVVNATGVLLHTNLGRAPLSAAAVEAVVAAAGPTDVELDLTSGRRTGRGLGMVEALAAAVPDAEAVHVVNNGAAALVLAATALAMGREIVISRGELVEIGDGFRLPDLLTSTGATLREVGTTNRTALADYTAAVGPETGFVLKVHPSNFVVTGFTADVPIEELATLQAPVVADIGSGLLTPHPLLPDEPDAAGTLRAGADLVIASGDKLLGGPQCGIIAGRADLVHRLRRHPLARALRVGKLTIAALEATLRVPPTPTARALATGRAELRARAEALAATLRAQGVEAQAVDSEATVGGGGAPGVPIASAAVRLPESYAERLRHAPHPVMTRVTNGACLVDLLAVPPTADTRIVDAVTAC